ncbi:MAG: type IV pilus twitching motility protein PilT [Krumholzibacteria bacterium]|nr:type IV pilus twitching motility protein PilT [Candidatus Krumholzibacteria bacterium]
MPRIDAFLKIMRNHGVSDLHLSANTEPRLRINGDLQRGEHRQLSEDELKIIMYELLTDTQIGQLEANGDLDCAYTLPGVARFRINIYRKHPGLAAAFRMIPNEVPTLESLGFPPVLKNLLEHRSGLVLVTGPTNSGKSTTLAAMVDHLNDTQDRHVITLEDPLEFIHPNKRCLINQRQVGEHCRDFASALRAGLREDPDVILVGEMRDLETISLALTAAEVGQLVLGTLHTKSAAQTISRIVDPFPGNQQTQVRHMLSEVLIGICSQQLLRRQDGRGRIAALEILVGNPAIRNLIREQKSHLINNAITTGRKEGMQLLDQHLGQLVDEGTVTVEEALRFAAEPQNFASRRPVPARPVRVMS